MPFFRRNKRRSVLPRDHIAAAKESACGSVARQGRQPHQSFSGVLGIHRTSVGLLLEDQLGTRPPSIVYGNAGNSPIDTSTPAGRLNLF
jgi:hypothetical protein